METGIFGYGKMGRLRHRVLDEFGGHRVAHVCDPRPLAGDFRVTADPAELADFFTAVQTGGPLSCGGSRDSLELMCMIERIYKDGGCPGTA